MKHVLQALLHIFQLECPDINLSKPLIDIFCPGGIIGHDLDAFDLNIPNPGGSIGDINTLIVHAHAFSKHFNASAQSLLNCPFTFDTGACSELTPFKSDVLNSYK